MTMTQIYQVFLLETQITHETFQSKMKPGESLHPWNNNTQQTPSRLFLIMIFEAIKKISETEKSDALIQFYYLFVKLLGNPACQNLYKDKLWILSAIYELLNCKFSQQTFWEYFLKVDQSLFED